jgi:hypothetical protein
MRVKGSSERARYGDGAREKERGLVEEELGQGAAVHVVAAPGPLQIVEPLHALRPPRAARPSLVDL